VLYTFIYLYLYIYIFFFATMDVCMGIKKLWKAFQTCLYPSLQAVINEKFISNKHISVSSILFLTFIISLMKKVQ
jgi:hypothetical protein